MSLGLHWLQPAQVHTPVGRDAQIGFGASRSGWRIDFVKRFHSRGQPQQHGQKKGRFHAVESITGGLALRSRAKEWLQEWDRDGSLADRRSLPGTERRPSLIRLRSEEILV